MQCLGIHGAFQLICDISATRKEAQAKKLSKATEDSEAPFERGVDGGMLPVVSRKDRPDHKCCTRFSLDKATENQDAQPTANPPQGGSSKGKEVQGVKSTKAVYVAPRKGPEGFLRFATGANKELVGAVGHNCGTIFSKAQRHAFLCLNKYFRRSDGRSVLQEFIADQKSVAPGSKLDTVWRCPQQVKSFVRHFSLSTLFWCRRIYSQTWCRSPLRRGSSTRRARSISTTRKSSLTRMRS